MAGYESLVKNNGLACKSPQPLTGEKYWKGIGITFAKKQPGQAGVSEYKGLQLPGGIMAGKE